MAEVVESLLCFHCGDKCLDDLILSDGKHFCCHGCKMVYEILQENNLCTFYTLNNSPGNKQNVNPVSNRFSYLDEASIKEKLISFKDNHKVYITFYIPKMHCSSCIWLLENMHRINDGVLSPRVDFLKKEVSIIYDESKTSLKLIVEQLANIGYEPSIHLDSLDQKSLKVGNKSRLYRIGVAGFCLGNIMMLSFPEYFSGGAILEPGLKLYFSYLILFLSLPVFFYCSSEFFRNSWKGIKLKSMSIDIPIALGIFVMFLRSSYDILSQSGPGYLDSMSGLVFFMLVGRNFQAFTFDSLSFERDYKSYFPLAVTLFKNGIEKSVPVYNLSLNDIILIRNSEIIPVDSILLNGNAEIDYSFVTGESSIDKVQQGEIIFAGGKQSGSIIELKVLKEVSQSHLTQLWGRQISTANINNYQKYVGIFSQWFIIITLSIATATFLFWIGTDFHRALNAFTSVLIIACPCAFTLSAPFTFGNILRILGKNKIFLKNNSTIERLAEIDTIVFDKTGTLTMNDDSIPTFIGEKNSSFEEQLIYSLVRQSSHPLSQKLLKSFKNLKQLSIDNFKEYVGEGIEGMINGYDVKLGKLSFVCKENAINKIHQNSSSVFISFNGKVKGYYLFKNEYRPSIEVLIGKLRQRSYILSVLSGDNNSETGNLRKIFSKEEELLFQQTPIDKLEYIKNLQARGKKVLMIGDGLNDAGALLQSDVGISISDDINNFSPASDGIIDSSRFYAISSLLQYSKAAIWIIKCSFIFSLIYNFIGLYYAVQGTLSPVIAAILMPISTISLVLFAVIISSYLGNYFSIWKTDMNHLKG